jgi:hypothetical protein
MEDCLFITGYYDGQTLHAWEVNLDNATPHTGHLFGVDVGPPHRDTIDETVTAQNYFLVFTNMNADVVYTDPNDIGVKYLIRDLPSGHYYVDSGDPSALAEMRTYLSKYLEPVCLQ